MKPAVFEKLFWDARIGALVAEDPPPNYYETPIPLCPCWHVETSTSDETSMDDYQDDLIMSENYDEPAILSTTHASLTSTHETQTPMMSWHDETTTGWVDMILETADSELDGSNETVTTMANLNLVPDFLNEIGNSHTRNSSCSETYPPPNSFHEQMGGVLDKLQLDGHNDFSVWDELVKWFHDGETYSSAIIVISGRNEQYYESTESFLWLNKEWHQD